MLREIQPTSADEQTSVRKRDRLDEPAAKDVRHIDAAIEEDLGVECVRGAHERPPVHGECVLLDLMDEDPCQRPAPVDVVDLEATEDRSTNCSQQFVGTHNETLSRRRDARPQSRSFARAEDPAVRASLRVLKKC